MDEAWLQDETSLEYEGLLIEIPQRQVDLETVEPIELESTYQSMTLPRASRARSLMILTIRLDSTPPSDPITRNKRSPVRSP